MDRPGIYRFRLPSDDGSKLYMDDKPLFDNDGTHSPLEIEGSAHFSRGVHSIRVSYFQGPRHQVALVLSVARPDSGDWKTSTRTTIDRHRTLANGYRGS